MERVYYVIDKNEKHYILNCASYGFGDDEEVMSSTNDIVCSIDVNLVVNQYVKFEDEKVEKTEDKYYVSGKPLLLKNKITNEDRELYDKEFSLSIDAYLNNDEVGIERWNKYLKEYEEKFMSFEEV